MINILKTNKEISKKDLYYLTMAPDSTKMSEAVGETIDIQYAVIYEDVRNDKTSTVSAIMDVDGRVYATNSNSFKERLEDILEFFPDEEISIKVCQGTSKSGRPYIYCTLAR